MPWKLIPVLAVSADSPLQRFFVLDPDLEFYFFDVGWIFEVTSLLFLSLLLLLLLSCWPALARPTWLSI